MKRKILSLVLVMVLALFCFAAAACSKKNDDTKTPDTGNEPTKTAWPEAGVYYFDDVNYENLLTLNVGDTFSLLVKGTFYSGKYTLTDAVLVLDFNAEDKQDVTANYEGNVIAFEFEGAAMRFLKKINYTVSFNVDGGSAIDAQTVVNGKSATKPADPQRDGYVFVGWYKDAAFTTPYAFGATPVTEDTTVYARWIAESADGKEFTVAFDLNYAGAPAVSSVKTSGGKVFDLPSDFTRDGYTFGGWWYSEFSDGSMLSYKVEDGSAVNANTTLYALWIENTTGSQLAAPVLNVSANRISWNAVNGAKDYVVMVVAPDGEVVLDATTSANVYNFNFADYAAGTYEVRVTARANSGEANNSVSVRYFANKTLAKVSVFNVYGSTLYFGAVENAEKYLVTVVCGNPEHNHTAKDNGSSRTFDFSNCTMTKDGIKFTVTAVAEGYASSTSDVFTFVRTLENVSGFRYDEATQTLSWNEVPFAKHYMVCVTYANSEAQDVFVNFGSQTFVSLKDYASGNIVVKVYAVADGYNSSETAEYTLTKTTLATPSNLLLNGNVLSWNEVEGATSYEVKVNGVAHTATTNSLDLTPYVDVVEGLDYTLTVRALGANSSLESDTLVARYGEMNENVTYVDGKLNWAPVIGTQYYEIQVNDGAIVKVEGGVFASAVTFNKEGANTVKVRFVAGSYASEWATTTVNAYRVVFDTLGGNTIATQYKAVGDAMDLAVAEKAGYTFVAWYNVPGGATNNGAAYTDKFFNENTSLVLYAYYKANKYTVTYNYGVGGTGNVESEEVSFESNYQLTVPTASNEAGAFGGWFSAPYGMGVQYTDETGKSLAPWTNLEDVELYAFWIDETLSFTLTKVNGKDAYAVSKGSRIALVNELTIPAYYRGLPVAFISGNAFVDCTNLTVINLPETIEQISIISPFAGCSSLTAINVYDVEGVAAPVFASEDGVLLDVSNENNTKLALVPMAKTGTYRIPAGVTEIPEAAFANSSLSKVVISAEVTMIGREAFKDATKLSSVVFEVDTTGASVPLTIGTRAFLNCTKLEKITLPARLTDIKLQRYVLSDGTVSLTDGDSAFTGCLALKSINVSANNQTYMSVDSVLFSKDGKTLLFAPASIDATYVIPEGTRSIAAGAFVGCTYLENVTVPYTVVAIGECAFYGLNNLKVVTFQGGAFNDLTVSRYAFADCTKLSTVNVEAGSRLAVLDEGTFKGCTALNSFEFPAAMTSVGVSAFADCTALSSVSFAEGGKTLAFGANAFQNCTSLSTVSLPANVSKIPGVFAGCTSLTTVEIAEGSPYFVSEDGVVYDAAKTEIVFFPQGKTGDYVVPETVVSINNGIFQNVKKLSSISISNSVTYIGDYAFNGANIPSITFYGEATGSLVIGENAFNGATLGSLELPAHTVSIGNSAFYEANITSLTLNEGIETLGDYAFWGSAVELTVPASVKSIGAYCFGGYRVYDYDIWAYVTAYADVTLTVENSQLETIGDYAFYQNRIIEDVEIPASVKSIGNHAFDDCYSLSSITFAPNSSLETIGDYAFANSDNVEEITLPGSLKSIGAYAFYYCYYLESVTFEEGQNDLVIGDFAFYYGYYLENVVLSSNVTVLGNSAFKYCGYYGYNGLEVTINNIENSRLTTIGAECFYSSELKSFVIPKSVSNLPPVTDPATGETYDRLGIGAKAFYGLYGTLTSLTFEMGGTLPLTIGENAFDNAALLTEVVLPARLAPYTSYTGDVIDPLANGGRVFNSCDNLTNITVEDVAGAYYTTVNGVLMTADMKEIVLCPMSFEGSFTVPATVTKIHAYAFYEVEGLTEIIFEQGTEDMTIGERAFAYCSGLTSIVLSDNVVSLGESVFLYCSNLESLTLSKKLVSFTSYDMVNYCNKLAQINVGADGQGENFSSVNGILYNADKTALVAYPAAKTDETVTVESSVKVIFTQAFMQNSHIVTVVLPEGLIEIQASAFNNCANLTEINIPSTVQYVGKNAFNYCKTLTTVTFAEGGDDPLIFEAYAFAYTYKLGPVALPARLYSIGDNSFYQSGLTYATFDKDSKLVAIGNSAFAESSLIEMHVPAGVVTLGDRAFYNCDALLEITFSEGLLEVGSYAFAGCDQLISVRFPASLKTLGTSIFYLYEYGQYNCPNLESVVFASGSQLTYIPAGTFAYTALKTFTVPAGVITIEGVESSVGEKNPSAFYEIATLESVYFENGSQCATIGNYAFAECEALKVFEIPATVSTLGNYAFNYCRALESIVIPETTTNLGNGAFWGCESLVEVELRTKATAIPDSFFYGCSSLANVTLPASVSSLGSGCFSGTALAEIKVDPRNTFFKAIDGILYTADGTGIVMVPANKEIGEFVVPNTVTSIGKKLFYECETITSLVFEGGRTTYLEIGDMAFAKCVNLSKVIFTDMISYVGEEAFYYCSSLNYVEIAPDMTEDIFGYDAFYGCSIYEVKNLSTMELEAGDYYACEGLVSNALRVFTEGESLITVVDGFVLMDLDGEVYLIAYNGDETDIVVPEGVTIINTYAFDDSISNLNSVTLSSTVRVIADGAFYYSTAKTVVLNEGLEEIGYEAFYYSKVANINLPSTLKKIGQEAFYGAKLKGSITIPDGLTTIGKSAFYYTNEQLTFVVTMNEAPEGWHSTWNKYDYYDDHMVLWGFTGEEITYNFVTNGGEAVESITSAYPITIPTGPNYDGYYFQGWYDNAEFEGEALSGTYYNGEKTTFYAKWMTQEEFDALYAGTSMEYAIEINLGEDLVADITKGGQYIYYKFTTDAAGNYNFYLYGGDTMIYLYSESGSREKTFYAEYANGGYTTIDEEYSLKANTTYYIAVRFYYSSDTGALDLNISKV